MGTVFSGVPESVPEMGEEELQNEYRDAFEIFPRDQDGRISRFDLERLLKITGVAINDAQCQELIAEVEDDKENSNSHDRKSFRDFQRIIQHSRRSTDLNFEIYDCIEFLNVTRKECRRKDVLEDQAWKDIIGEGRDQLKREVEVMAKNGSIGIDQLVQILTKPRSAEMY